MSKCLKILSKILNTSKLLPTSLNRSGFPNCKLSIVFVRRAHKSIWTIRSIYVQSNPFEKFFFSLESICKLFCCLYKTYILWCWDNLRVCDSKYLHVPSISTQRKTICYFFQLQKQLLYVLFSCIINRLMQIIQRLSPSKMSWHILSHIFIYYIYFLCNFITGVKGQ